MTNTELQRYDFAGAARVKLALRNKINGWARKSVELMGEQWSMMSQSPLTASIESIDAKSFGETQASWANPSSAVALTIGDEPLVGMLIGENNQLRILLMDILGGCDSETKQQPLTPIEVSMASLVFELFTVSFSEGWPEQNPLPCRIDGFDPFPNRSRVLPIDEQVLLIRLKIKVSDSTVVLELVLPHVATQSLFGFDANQSNSNQTLRPISADKIATIDVELIAMLGQAEIDMSAIAQLTPGDIIVLDQPVLSPLKITANRQPVFTAWPGKNSNMQTLKLQKVLEPRP